MNGWSPQAWTDLQCMRISVLAFAFHEQDPRVRTIDEDFRAYVVDLVVNMQKVSTVMKNTSDKSTAPRSSMGKLLMNIS